MPVLTVVQAECPVSVWPRRCSTLLSVPTGHWTSSSNTWFKINSQGTPIVFPGTRSWTAGCLGRRAVIPVLRASFQDWDPPFGVPAQQREGSWTVIQGGSCGHWKKIRCFVCFLFSVSCESLPYKQLSHCFHEAGQRLAKKYFQPRPVWLISSVQCYQLLSSYFSENWGKENTLLCDSGRLCFYRFEMRPKTAFPYVLPSRPQTGFLQGMKTQLFGNWHQWQNINTFPTSPSHMSAKALGANYWLDISRSQDDGESPWTFLTGVSKLL